MLPSQPDARPYDDGASVYAHDEGLPPAAKGQAVRVDDKVADDTLRRAKTPGVERTAVTPPAKRTRPNVERVADDAPRRGNTTGVERANATATPKRNRRNTTTSRVSTSGLEADAAVICEKCDGAHATDSCPHFKGGRISHPDGKRKNFKGSLGADEGKKPGDGSCLFHSLAEGLSRLDETTRVVSGQVLRTVLADWYRIHQETMLNGSTLREWIEWDSDRPSETVEQYAERINTGAWGGGIEMAAFSHLYDVAVHVYERSSSDDNSYQFKRISRFDARSYMLATTQQPAAGAGRRSFVAVLYVGSDNEHNDHYDALVAHGDPVELDAVATPGSVPVVIDESTTIVDDDPNVRPFHLRKSFIFF
jgi:hypothetical protein